MRGGGKCYSPALTHRLRRSPPTPEGRELFLWWWILRLRLRLRAEWQGGRHTAKSDSFRTRETNRKEIWCRVDWLSWYSVHRFWFDPVSIVFGMMLWVLALEWRFSYWLLIDVCNGFGLMLCKLVFNWFMSLIKNKVSSFLKFVAAHFMNWILLPISQLTLLSFCTRACPELQNPLFQKVTDNLLTWENLNWLIKDSESSPSVETIPYKMI